ncbi:MAG: hypothetical protein IJV91_03540 [Kiritimatiellae bacterium]|nr:hypothetical protein [Kiritimatiellia bacterium]
MIRQFRTPLFKSLSVDVEAIKEEFDYLTDEQAQEVAELFASYLTDPDAWDMVQTIALDIWNS